MQKISKVEFPEFVVPRLERSVDIIITEGEFLDDPDSFPSEESKEMATIHLWNILGQHMLEEYLRTGDSEQLPNPDDLHKILINVILQTNLDSLMADNLIDGIENENGEMVYFLTDKGKEIHKNLDDPES